MSKGVFGVGPDYQFDTPLAGTTADQFDLSGYLSKTSSSATERLQWQPEAKEAQIDSRVALYEVQIDRLWTQIDVHCDDLQQLEDTMWRTDEKEKQVAEKLSDLYGELREVRQRFHRELRDLEDKRITLQVELEACTEGQELIALAEDWL